MAIAQLRKAEDSWTQIDPNDGEMKEMLQDALKKLPEARKKREHANAELKELQARLYAKGLHPRVWKLLVWLANADQRDRDWFGYAMPIALRMSGIPMQQNLNLAPKDSPESR